MSEVTLELVTEDSGTGEFVLYIVDRGASAEPSIEVRLAGLRQRIEDAFFVATQGALAEQFPESLSRRVRIQVDSPFDASPEVEALVGRFQA